MPGSQEERPAGRRRHAGDRTGRPDGELEMRSRGWRVIAVVAAGPLFLLPSLANLLTHPGLGGVVHDVASAVVGLGLIGRGLLVVGYAIRRGYRKSGPAARLAKMRRDHLRS